MAVASRTKSAPPGPKLHRMGWFGGGGDTTHEADKSAPGPEDNLPREERSCDKVIAVVGQQGAGKTALIASLQSSISNNGHGYFEQHIAAPVACGEVVEGLVGFKSDAFAAMHSTGYGIPWPQPSGEHISAATMSVTDSRAGVSGSSWWVSVLSRGHNRSPTIGVVDIPEAALFSERNWCRVPSSNSADDGTSTIQSDMPLWQTVLEAADHLVVCVPLLPDMRERVGDNISELLNSVANGDFRATGHRRNFKSVVVAFTFYDLAFPRFSTYGFESMHNADNATAAIIDHLKTSPGTRSLLEHFARALRRRGIRVRAVPTSVPGILSDGVINLNCWELDSTLQAGQVPNFIPLMRRRDQGSPYAGPANSALLNGPASPTDRASAEIIDGLGFDDDNVAVPAQAIADPGPQLPEAVGTAPLTPVDPNRNFDPEESPTLPETKWYPFMTGNVVLASLTRRKAHLVFELAALLRQTG